MCEKIKWLEKYAPPGIQVTKGVWGYIGSVMLVTFQTTLQFLNNYIQEREHLFTYYTGKPEVIEGTMIPSFSKLTENIFVLAEVVCVVTLLMTIYNYMYHYQGSKMMYLMKRLPDKWEVHRRCGTLPVAGAVLMVMWMMILKMLYYAIYILCTPSQCLPLPM